MGHKRRARIRRRIGKLLRWAAPIAEEVIRDYVRTEAGKRVAWEIAKQTRASSLDL